MNKISCLVLIGCLFFLQGCFEIIEQVLVKNDGSGDFQLIVNMSKSKTRLNSITKMKTVNGHKVPGKDEINETISRIEKTVKNTPGITNVKTSIDFNNYIATLSCNFLKIDNLNAGIKNVAKNEKSTVPVENTFEYDASSQTFSRFNKFLLKEEYQKMSNADKEIFATANYTSIFRFERDVLGASNTASRIASNKKAVMLKLNALDILTNKRSVENKIKLVK